MSSWEELKRKGNDCFTKQDYEGALTYYSKALEESPAEHVLYSNRSVVLFKLGRHGEALKDAVRCIELEPSFARGHLRKSTALNELGRHQEAMESAQEAYRLRGSDAISRNSVNQWLLAAKVVMKVKVEPFQHVIPDQILVISDEYLAVFLDVLLARVNSAAGVSVDAMEAYLSSALREFDRVLLLFGHTRNPCGDEWVKALCEASKLNPSTYEISPKAVATVLSKSDELATWLHGEVDHILYPIICPIISLAIMAVCTRIFSLNYASVDQHVVQVACQACLPFFQKSLLSGRTYADQHIAIYKELLEAMAKYRHTFSKEETRSVEEYLQKLRSLIQDNPQCDSDVLDKALGSIRLINYRLGRDPEYDQMPFILKAIHSGSTEEVLSFVEAKEKLLMATINRVIQGGVLPESVYNDARSLLICTGTLIKAGRPEKAAELFRLGETVFSVILQTQIHSEAFSLDTASNVFTIMQSIALSCAKSFLGTNDELIANAIIKWKCVFSEFRALLIQFGVGAKYREAFKAIQDVQVKGEALTHKFDAKLIQLAYDHQKEVCQVICDKGQYLLAILFDTYELVQRTLKPGQIVLDYCTAPDQDSIATNTRGPQKSYGMLLILQSEGKPVVKEINFAEGGEYANQWLQHSSKCSEDEVLKLTIEVCNVLIPDDIQAIISSSDVKEVLVCPDSLYTLVPFELLPLPCGKKLGEKCSVVYRSAARELLRNSTLSVAESVFSVVDESLKEDETSFANEDDQSLLPIQDAATNAPGPIEPPTKQCFIVADPNYDLERTVVNGDTSIFQKMTAAISALFQQPVEESNLPCRLRKSRDEAYEIQHTFSLIESPLKTHCILGDDATLSFVLQVQSPFLLHFSTHGFAKYSSTGVAGTFWDDTKCGLLLAGASTYLRGDLSKVDPAGGTGVLSGLAVMGMNLRDTRLVFLSLCTSAGGSVAPNESVNSLAHAFRTAGAQTVVGTLWKVVDNDARVFAVEFYKACRTGIRPSQALASAKKKMQDLGYKWSHWSSFVCIGEDVALFPAA